MSRTDEQLTRRDSSLDSASAVMLSLGLIAGLVQLGYRPFLFGPIGAPERSC